MVKRWINTGIRYNLDISISNVITAIEELQNFAKENELTKENHFVEADYSDRYPEYIINMVRLETDKEEQERLNKSKKIKKTKEDKEQKEREMLKKLKEKYEKD